VRIQTASNFVGPVRDTTITITSGSYSKGGLLEGPYMVTASEGDSAAVWNFLVTLAGNTSATMASRKTQGSLDDKVVNFRATRMDTQVRGVVINDRDQDLTTIDPDEALAGVTIQLYRDGSGAITLSADSLIGTTTTDANGAYSFTGLREGRYIAQATSLTNALVLRGLSKDTAVVTTAATTVGSGANNTRVVGSNTPGTLPRWDYNNSVADGGYLPANFTFIFNNTTVKGSVKTGGGVAVPGMTISLRRCNVSNPALTTSPPTGAGTCTTYLGTTVNMTSDAAGAFTFGSLVEGVYEIRPQPTTVAGWTTSTPAQILYITVGQGDVETYNFVIS
jgi:protocatechuate 3,4-dioxygenase beta subunit